MHLDRFKKAKGKRVIIQPFQQISLDFHAFQNANKKDVSIVGAFPKKGNQHSVMAKHELIEVKLRV